MSKDISEVELRDLSGVDEENLSSEPFASEGNQRSFSAQSAPSKVAQLFSRYYHRALRTRFRSQRTVIWCALAFCLLVTLLVGINHHPTGQRALNSARYRYHSSLSSKKEVSHKKDLLNVDISQMLKFKSWDNSPITHDVVSQDFETGKLVGYVSNLAMGLTGKADSLARRSSSKEDFADVLDSHESYDTRVTCKDLEYTNTFEYSKEKKVLEDDLIQLRQDIIDNMPHLASAFDTEAEKNWPPAKIVKERWFRFGSSAVWLEKENCYLVVSRVMYSTRGIKDYPKISLVRVQAFDRDWKEIKGKKVRYNDVRQPDDLEAELDNINSEMGLHDCKKFKQGSSEHSACLVENTKKTLNAQRRKQKIASKYVITYPTLLDIEFPTDGSLRGPEDPRIIVKRGNDVSEEPVILFNMKDESEGKRFMYAYLPHRKTEPMIKFRIQNRNPRSSEKNWTPFFHDDIEDSIISRGIIHFVYSFSPLEILKCSLTDGNCELVFEADTLDISQNNKFGGIRGGTQYIPLPDVLPRVKGKHLWFGFPKLHLNDCGCGKKFYRPMLNLLLEHDGVYHEELLVPSLDFGMDILSWDEKNTECSGVNILSPNSIAYWAVVGQKLGSKEFEDYMEVTVSEADSVSKQLVLKGVLNYVLGIYKEKDIQETFSVSEQSNTIVGHTLKCVVKGAEDSCKVYGEKHPSLGN